MRILLITVACIVFGMLAAFLGCFFYPSAVNWLAHGPLGFLRWRNVVGRILGAIRVYGRSPGTLAMAFGISFVANLTVIGVLMLGVLAVNPAPLTTKMFIIVPMGLVANSLPLTPGGLGVGETAFSALFKITGLHGGAEALLCWRIWSALVGLLGLVIYLRGFQGRVLDAESL